MKNQLIQDLTKPLLIFALTIATMQAQEVQKPNIKLMIVNNSTEIIKILTGKELMPLTEQLNIGPGMKQELKISSLWHLIKNEYYRLVIQPDATTLIFTPLFLRGTSQALTVTNLETGELSEFSLNPAIEQTITITYNPDETVSINMPSAPYYTQELPEKLRSKQPIKIKEQEFQVPEELIKLRAPKIRELTE